MYNRGTLQQFNLWHNAVKLAESIPRIGYVNNVPAPQNQGTTAYSDAIQNPDNSNDYIWNYGAYPDPELPIIDIENFSW